MMNALLMGLAIAALAVPAIAQDNPAPGASATEAMDKAADAMSEAVSEAARAAGAAADAAASAAAGVAADAADAASAAAADAAAALSENTATDPAATDPIATDPAAIGLPAPDASVPSMRASWVQGLEVYTTNQPSNSGWSLPEAGAIPADWDAIAKIGDIVIDEVDGQYVVAGYVIDIGGFLGIGVKQVLISTDAIKMATFGSDVVFATNYTHEELAALPDFDDSTLLPATLAPPPADAVDAATPGAAPADPAASGGAGGTAPGN